ncbi:methyl-accepting chemotaxis protein [Bombella apis]|uniref:methyl-accepting chemotaxis protein n=1 Tax=Bombella apis TaxID=1785988 RepID=UPI0024A92D8C|nr:methyl-accepting chemotaxis protein [Bombella apis]
MFNWLYKSAPFRVQVRVAMLAIELYLAVQLLVEGVGYVQSGIFSRVSIINMATLLFGMVLVWAVWFFLTKALTEPIEKLTAMGMGLSRGESPDLSLYDNRTNCVGRVGRMLASFALSLQEQKAAEKAHSEAVNKALETTEKLKEREARTHAVVEELNRVMQLLAQGNLSIRITSALFDGEFGPVREAFNESLTGLGGALSVVAESSNMIANGASEISTASDDLAKRTERQAASLGQVTASVKSIASGFKVTASNCSHASSETKATLEKVKTASNGMEQTSVAMNSIKTSSDDIVQITRSVSDIAFKTNVLALNASVEAARAGEAGRGFAVVAKEVQSLAEQSAKAADMIRDVLETATAHVQEGVRLVARTSGLLKDVEEGTEALADRVEVVSKATEEQARSLAEVSDAVSSMDGMTQQNAAMVEESTAASHNLTTQTVKLRQTLATFTIGSSQRLKLSHERPALPNETAAQTQPKSSTPMLSSQRGEIQQDGKILPTHSDDEAGWDHF